jgi:flagellar export protein FliJ
MRRFVWRLQRVLDIREKEEQKARAELFELAEKLAATRGELLMQQKMLEDIIHGLAGENPESRLDKQEFFLRHSVTSDERIRELKDKIHVLERQQREKVAEVLKIRRYKQGLEKLRAQAREEFIAEQERLEQKELDERAGVSFVRKTQS